MKASIFGLWETTRSIGNWQNDD